jgi:hypothetical protein
MRKTLICMVLLTVILTGCKQTTVTSGSLQGTVTIGPLTPVERPGVNPPVSSEVFTSRKILVYNDTGMNLLHTLDITQIGQTASGRYEISLAPGVYTINITPNGIDRSGEVPKKVIVKSGETTVLDINVDTGIR